MDEIKETLKKYGLTYIADILDSMKNANQALKAENDKLWKQRKLFEEKIEKLQKEVDVLRGSKDK